MNCHGAYRIVAKCWHHPLLSGEAGPDLPAIRITGHKQGLDDNQEFTMVESECSRFAVCFALFSSFVAGSHPVTVEPDLEHLGALHLQVNLIQPT